MAADVTVPVIDLLSSLLVALGYGTEGSTLFVDHLPDDTDNVVCLLDMGSTEGEYAPVIESNVLVLVRNSSRTAAAQLAFNIYNAVRSDANWPREGSGVHLWSALAVNMPKNDGSDYKRRWEYSFSMTLRGRRKA